MDPISGQGIGNAFREAELVAGAVADGLGGEGSLEEGLAEAARVRDHELLPMYEFTKELAALAPTPVEAEVLFRSLLGRQEEIDRFLGVMTGSVPMREYFTPGNLRRVIGLRGMARIALGKIRSRGKTAERAAALTGAPRTSPVR